MVIPYLEGRRLHLVAPALVAPALALVVNRAAALVLAAVQASQARLHLLLPVDQLVPPAALMRIAVALATLEEGLAGTSVRLETAVPHHEYLSRPNKPKHPLHINT